MRFMVRLTEDNIGDMESPDWRMERRVGDAGRHVMNNIGAVSADVRSALTSQTWFAAMFPDRIQRTARQFKAEANNQITDVPARYRTGFERDAAHYRAERLAIPEHQLANSRNAINIVPTQPVVLRNISATNATGTVVPVDIEIAPTATFWNNQTLNPNFQTTLAGMTPAMMVNAGITVRGANFHHFTPEQTEAIATAYTAVMMSFQNIARLFSSNGTSELNIQSALAIAQRHPEEVLAATSASSEEVNNAYNASLAKMQLFQAVTDLGAITRVDTIRSFTWATNEFNRLQTDITNIANFDTRPTADLSQRGQDLINEGHSYATEPALILSELRAEVRAMTTVLNRFRQVAAALERVYAAARTANIVVPAIEQYIDTTTNHINDAMLTAGIDPKIIADQLILAMNLVSREAIQKEIADADEARTNFASSIPPGREAITRAYVVHFMHQGASETEARIEAEKLYGLNAVGHSEWNVAKQTLEREDVLGQESRIMDWPKEQLKEWMYGSQESFICHIAESSAIGLQHEITNRFYSPLLVGPRFTRIMDDTRRFGFLWRKRNARPSWAAMDYHQLLTAFYAIRNATRSHDLPNSSYVRNTTDEIVRLLLDKFSVNFSHDFDTPERRGLDAAHQQKLLHDDIRLLIASDPPPEIANDVNSAIAYAKRETGKYRKWAGTTIRDAAGFGKKTYTSIPARAVIATVKAPVQAVTWTYGKITGGLKSLWKKAGEETTFFS